MSDLRFDSGENEFGRPPQYAQGNDLADKLVAWGLVGDKQQATYLLIGIGVIALVVALFFMMGGGSDTPPPPPTGV